MKRSWPRHPRGGWSSSTSGKFSGKMAMTEGQAWADLERGSSGDLHTLLPPGLLDSFSNCPYNFFCIQCMRACAHTHTYTQSLELPLQFLLRSAHTHTHLLRAKVRTRLQQQKSHQRVHTHTHTHTESHWDCLYNFSCV